MGGLPYLRARVTLASGLTFSLVNTPGGVNPPTRGLNFLNVEPSIRCDHNQNPAVCKVTKINYNEKTAKKKRRASWFSQLGKKLGLF